MYASATPPAYAGTNGDGERTTFSLAVKLVHGFCLDGDTALSILTAHYNPRCHPQWSDKELLHKVSDAIKSPSPQQRGWLLKSDEHDQIKPVRLPIRTVEPPKVDVLANVNKFLDGFRCKESDLAAYSTLRHDFGEAPLHYQAATLIMQLFEPTDWVNIVSQSKQNGQGKWHPVGYGKTLPRNEWLRQLLEPFPARPGGAWIRMNPLNGMGVADSDVTAFRYALLEFDDIPLELQLSLFAKVTLPIAAITYSGGRSYHAWVKVDASSLDDYKNYVAKLYRLAKPLGVDQANKNPSRMSRLPGVYRGDQQQRLVYLNPECSAKEML